MSSGGGGEGVVELYPGLSTLKQEATRKECLQNQVGGGGDLLLFSIGG